MRNIIGLGIAFAIAATCAGIFGCERKADENRTRTSSATSQPTAAPSEAELAAARKAVGGGLTASGTAAGTAAGLPPGHPSLTPGDAAPPAPTPSSSAKSLKLDTPASWQSTPPANPSRLAQYTLPTTAPGQAVTELVVTAFPRTAGMADPASNIARWKGQFTTVDGQPLPDAAVATEEKLLSDMPLHVARMTGRYAVSPSMGGTGQASDMDYRLLAAMLISQDRVYFLKLVGPVAAVTAAEADFDKVIESMRLE